MFAPFAPDVPGMDDDGRVNGDGAMQRGGHFAEQVGGGRDGKGEAARAIERGPEIFGAHKTVRAADVRMGCPHGSRPGVAQAAAINVQAVTGGAVASADEAGGRAASAEGGGPRGGVARSGERWGRRRCQRGRAGAGSEDAFVAVAGLGHFACARDRERRGEGDGREHAHGPGNSIVAGEEARRVAAIAGRRRPVEGRCNRDFACRLHVASPSLAPA